MFSNVNIFGISIPKLLCGGSELLGYFFQHLLIENVSYFDTAYPIFQFIDGFFFFLTIFDDSYFFSWINPSSIMIQTDKEVWLDEP